MVVDAKIVKHGEVDGLAEAYPPQAECRREPEFGREKQIAEVFADAGYASGDWQTSWLWLHEVL